MRNFFGQSKQAILTFMVIVGTVIGSGFLSGKEIVVFFTRFGKMSYFCILLAFLLFWGLFYFFLMFGVPAIARLKKSKFANLLNILICFILSSAMFAGVYSLVEPFSVWIRILSLMLVAFYACRVAIKGASYLGKLNLILVPIMIVFLLASLVNLLTLKRGGLFIGSFYPYSLFYCFLYVILNCSNSAIVISSIGEKLSKKQKVQVSFFSSLALSLILLLANIVMLQNSFVFNADMPLLQLFSGAQKFLMSIIILLGCVTTLFSLVYSVSGSLRGLCDNIYFILFFSVALPLAVSFLGFGVIVSALYPLTSILGIFLLGDLFLIPFFKKVYKKIHAAGKKTE